MGIILNDWVERLKRVSDYYGVTGFQTGKSGTLEFKTDIVKDGVDETIELTLKGFVNHQALIYYNGINYGVINLYNLEEDISNVINDINS